MEFLPQLIPTVTSGLFSLASALLAALLAARWTKSRFYIERTWDRKATAYSTVFEGLHAMATWTGEVLDAEMEGRTLANEDELRDAYYSAKKNIRREIASATWLLPEAVDEVINELWSELRKRRDSWFEDLDESWGAIATAQTKLRAIAIADLGLAHPKPWWRRPLELIRRR